MPFVLAFIAILLIAVGVRGKTQDATALLASEFTGSDSFIPWFLAIIVLGLIGYYKPVRPVADAMLGLVILAIILAHGNPKAAGGGFFAQLNDAFRNATPSPAGQAGSAPTTGQIFGQVTNPANNPAAALPSYSGSLFDLWGQPIAGQGGNYPANFSSF